MDDYFTPQCPICSIDCDSIFVWKGSGTAIGCNICISEHDTDNDGFEDFICPNGCKIDSKFSTNVYADQNTGEPVGCQHCISEWGAYEYAD